MPQTDSVKTTYVNITAKLPQGLVDLYADISGHTNALDINYLVVGAMARDLVSGGCPRIGVVARES